MKRSLFTILALTVTALLLNGCVTTVSNGDARVTVSDSTTVAKTDSGKGPPAHAPAHGYRAKHNYLYYPDKSVYYDVGRRLFFYLEGDEWTVSVSLPSRYRMDLGSGVTLVLETDKPYQKHGEHARKYPPGKKKKDKKEKKKKKNKKYE